MSFVHKILPAEFWLQGFLGWSLAGWFFLLSYA